MAIASEVSNLSFTNLKTKSICKLQLRDTHLCVFGPDDSEKKAKLIRYEDIIGVKLNHVSSETSDNGGEPHRTATIHSIDIYAYPSTKMLFSSKFTRKRTSLSLCPTEKDSVKSNEVLQFLHEAIRSQILPQSHGTDSDLHTRFSKPLLVLLNPASGKSLAKKLFEEKISPMFKEAGVDYELIITDHRGHGEEIAHTLDIDKYYGLVIVSGDGLLYEVYQGLMKRSDSSQAIQVPIGILPAGSGNALCCSINYDAGEPHMYDLLMHSTYILLKHTIRPMDLVALDTVNGRIYSFLSVTWGIVADIDIESERFRNLGNARFTLEGLYRIAKPRTYKGRLSFLPNAPYVGKGRSRTEVAVIDREPESQTAGSSSRTRSVSMPDSPSKDMTEDQPCSSPLATPADSASLTAASSASIDPEQDADASSSTDNTPLPTHKPVTDKELTNDFPLPNGLAEMTGKLKTDYGSTVDSTVDLPPLNQPVPSNWVTIEDNFVTIIAAYQSHLGPEMMPTPIASFATGLIHLLIIRAPVTRMQMLNLMGQLESGAHVKSNIVELVEVKAFRLEPHANDGNLVVDGEKIDYGPIQGHVLPGVARVMAK